MITHTVPHADTGAAACGDLLDLVDIAAQRPKSREGDILRDHVCPTRPIAANCLDLAMTNGEFGIWGGTTPKQRTQAGAPPARNRGA